MRMRVMIISLTMLILLSLTACGGQTTDNGSNTQDPVATEKTTATTEGDLPEFTGTQEEETTDAANEKDSGSQAADQEEDTEFSGMDVEESTEIILDEGQDVEVY